MTHIIVRAYLGSAHLEFNRRPDKILRPNEELQVSQCHGKRRGMYRGVVQL